MYKLYIHRKKKFAGALMPYWVITDISKEEFMQRYSLDGCLSNEVTIQNTNIDEINLVLTTRAGFVGVSYPYFE